MYVRVEGCCSLCYILQAATAADNRAASRRLKVKLCWKDAALWQHDTLQPSPALVQLCTVYNASLPGVLQVGFQQYADWCLQMSCAWESQKDRAGLILAQLSLLFTCGLAITHMLQLDCKSKRSGQPACTSCGFILTTTCSVYT